MAGKGPQPTPTALLAARGSWRAKARGKAGEPRPADPLPAAPDYLTAGERSCYRRVAALLGQCRVGTAADVDAVARYACLLLHWRRCNEQVNREGLTILEASGENTVSRPNPAARLLTAIAAELRAMEDRFGLNPSARARLVVEQPTEADQAEAKFFKVVP
jgi:P27 family predicted phage terminase small subunit